MEQKLWRFSMKLIKSLFLGSAAGLVAISGASAADLAVTKPAPAEYVKVCSVGGMTGFTIPGSDVCLDIGGRVRFDVDFTDDKGDGDFGYDFQPQARLEFDARTDTSLGVLRSFIAVEFTDNEGLEVGLDRAFIQLGGFVVGRATSVMSFDSFDLTDRGFDGGADQISYTFASDAGFYVSLGIEERNLTTDLDGDGVGDTRFGEEGLVAGAIGYKGGETEVRLGGYVSTFETWGAVLTAQTSFGSGTTILAIAQYEDLDAVEVWRAGLKLSQKFNDSFSGSLAGSYEDFDAGESFAITAGFDYTIVPGFTVGPEVTYVSTDLDGPGGSTDGFGGRLRFQRNF
jgi:hypothetical protein